MRIAIIADPLDNQSAGVHVYTRELVKALLKYDIRNEFILIREKKDPNLSSIQQIVVPNTRLPIGYASFRLFVLIPQIARRLAVDAVFEPAHFGPFNLPAHIRRITMIHDLTPILFPQYHRLHSQWLQRLFLKRILKKADLILSNSQNTSRDLHKCYPFTESKTETLLLGKDDFFTPTSSRNFLDGHSITFPYFISVGTIEPRKNLTTLLKAFQLFRQTSTNRILLLIVGQKGWKSDSFFDALAQHPFRRDIILTGFVEKQYLPELYSHALALVYPSEYEGFGFPILEAMACGTQVICANNSSLPEVGGSLAAYFDTHDAAALAEQMHLTCQLPATATGLVAERVCWANQFSWKKYATNFSQAIANRFE